jgi:hypothetical protein
MASPRLLSCTALLVALAPGCVFFSDDDDCRYGLAGSGTDRVPVPGQRNPETGVCEYFGGGGGGGGCGDPCYPCPAGEGSAQAAPPTWGYCESQCTGLDESSCAAASGCRVIYVNPFYNDGPPVYAECWSTDMTGPIQGGSCEGLDATTCSMHDDCSAVHNQACEGGAPEPCPTGAFAYCTDEAGGDPRTGTCDGELTCERASPACPDGTTPGIAGGCYTGYCIPVDDCGSPGNAGLCYAPVTDDQAPPACPDGTTPGIGADGHYTGYCIPLEDCEAQPACSEIAAEATCIARADCLPIYQGEDCSCDQAGACTCAVWNYDHCQ